MASCSEDFLYEDDFDAVLAIIDSDFLDNDEEFESDLNTVIEKIPSSENPSFPCSHCQKICRSKGGLTRHNNAKHSDVSSDSSTSKTSKHTKKAEEILHPDQMKKMIEHGVIKLAADECYPESVTDMFKKFRLDNNSENIPGYSLIKPLLESFDGDLEKFYPKFYKVFTEDSNTFGTTLDRHCSLLLGFELANHVVAHITGATFQDEVLTLDNSEKKFTDKEMSIIAYLSGYVFGTFYRRIRFSKSSTKSTYHQECLSFLIAGKSSETNNPVYKHINLFDRGGLWRVNEDVISIFTVAETYFLSASKKSINNIDSKSIVAELLKNSLILTNFSKVRSNSQDKITKEIALNLLEDLLMLYIRLRTFSFVKDKVQAFKIRQSKTRSRSLRTTIKQQSKSLFQGH